jgi:hypothetical protein
MSVSCVCLHGSVAVPGMGIRLWAEHTKRPPHQQPGREQHCPRGAKTAEKSLSSASDLCCSPGYTALFFFKSPTKKQVLSPNSSSEQLDFAAGEGKMRFPHPTCHSKLS